MQNLFYALTFERTLDRYSQADTTEVDVTAKVDPAGRTAQLLSAFFGLDEGLPRIADWAVCDGAGGKDGMPVIFSHEVGLNTLEPGDFAIKRRSGKLGEVTCLTLAPADDPGELRTVLLAGQFGSESDPPVSVEITGDIISLDQSVTFKGAQVAVTPLEDGPSLVLAEKVPQGQWELGKAATGIPFGGGSGCPEGTAQVLRVTWEGGITKPDGNAADDQERKLYRVTIRQEDGSEETIAPMHLADTGDGDNNHKLCLDRTEPVKSIAFPAGGFTDPRGDLNPPTYIGVSQRLIDKQS
ncbi:hypothetical protein [Alterisphingorhabdus coralli]|uniref:Uncharacterized protein n=1 Tax=Alterisphingorhabdus coralli TaxID=3071408 RepID=A0AA97F6Z8_9SPHN|nr:hypothetical protein [Parasphingorhabdus sp. SCSIO 66989]WOE75356.1 hypothetical protein RB602_01170 [Parasphingorhabdus sp. SCSIO 66989]